MVKALDSHVLAKAIIDDLHFEYGEHLEMRASEIANADGSSIFEIRHVELAAKEPYVSSQYK